MWSDKLKKLGVNIHVIATGAGAGIQDTLWSEPGSSAYFGGASFPYSPEEQEELLGFMPTHFCSEEAAIDLASAAYMKAYKFGGKSPIGLGLTASVASEKEHRGDHRIFVCIITDNIVRTYSHTLMKGSGKDKRKADGFIANSLAQYLLCDALGINEFTDGIPFAIHEDKSKLARERFFANPFFTANGKRLQTLPDDNHWTLMSGAFNPPHEGHFGLAKNVLQKYNCRTVFEITAEPPHKEFLSIQDMLKRAKNLQGNDRLFTRNLCLYIDKAKAFPGTPLVLGADAMVRLFDPKWCKSPAELITLFYKLGTHFYVASRKIDNAIVNFEDIIGSISDKLNDTQLSIAYNIIKDLPGRWDISSSEIRDKL